VGPSRCPPPSAARAQGCRIKALRHGAVQAALHTACGARSACSISKAVALGSQGGGSMGGAGGSSSEGQLMTPLSAEEEEQADSFLAAEVRWGATWGKLLGLVVSCLLLHVSASLTMLR
jgi:hypothetical protein